MKLVFKMVGRGSQLAKCDMLGGISIAKVNHGILVRNRLLISFFIITRCVFEGFAKGGGQVESILNFMIL